MRQKDGGAAPELAGKEVLLAIGSWAGALQGRRTRGHGRAPTASNLVAKSGGCAAQVKKVGCRDPVSGADTRTLWVF